MPAEREAPATWEGHRMTDENVDREEWPITIKRAAAKLHRGARGLRRQCRIHGIGKRSGRAIIFDEVDFARLYESLP